MATFSLVSKRPLITLPFLLPSSCESVALELRRSQSTYRRTKQRLRVKPDASFGFTSNRSQDHIIFNPPSSAPSVYHTPTKFLPADDIRKTLRTSASTNHERPEELPTVYKSPTEKKYHLTPSDIEEIRKLRLTDPMTWSRWKLAKRFDCSPMFIGMVCEASPQKKEIQKQVLEAVQSRWGTKRRMAREDRQLRKESWGKDE
ncbi:mitochondrial 54S ribosomal protein mL58 [Aspergillus clavatus NRRL 1]|uniref:60S ribosomal protein L20, putative n=1 Tax=Aspergillus clavatus (strain ATCC 1007 / CBS 513.65 / DSM 816 / NCTC 3887 / NRRL 1 / QM 1276 / 107) TaxID=344612 RepID=A1CJ21_ASPCL|nr:mitochondrial 54S ribosomal protein YmL20 [Aspergillus clavatus NRRL 1]EAW09145.1 60S ribosomal protein L20, putative [Aspergillus clavatus NRRL 1]